KCSLVQAELTQSEPKSVNLGDNVEITCSGGSYGYYAWHQQKTPGTGPVTVIYDNTNRPSDIPSRFSGSLSGYTATLTITGVQAEDEAVYFLTQGDVEVSNRLVLKTKFFCPLPSRGQLWTLLFQRLIQKPSAIT
uniref:Immunoglobulin V-set domain-containing protein n=1 Tax=Anas zonorhyncha TaxID=75864 RepID=A0A8B9UH46_9AVES